MKALRKAGAAWPIFGGLAVVILFAALGVRGAAGALDPLHYVTSNARIQATTYAATERSEPTSVDSLPCFECHNYERFLDSDDMPHADHMEWVGHCHMCHGFDGHAEVTIRSSTCDECH